MDRKQIENIILDLSGRHELSDDEVKQLYDAEWDLDLLDKTPPSPMYEFRVINHTIIFVPKR